MSHKLTLEELIKEYKKADQEGKEYLKQAQQQKEYTLNAIATIKMDSFTQIKRHLIERIGELIIEQKQD